jgi:hypothetical protein
VVLRNNTRKTSPLRNNDKGGREAAFCLRNFGSDGAFFPPGYRHNSHKNQYVNSKIARCDACHPAARSSALGLILMRGNPDQEVAMTALIKKTRSRMVRWFKRFSEKNRSPYRWYEHDHFGI